MPIHYKCGTALLINENHGGERPLNVSFGMGIDKYDKEGRVISAEMAKYVLIVSYFPSLGK
jgi:exonuclease III